VLTWPRFSHPAMTILDADIDKLCQLSQLGLDRDERVQARADLERMIAMIDAIGAVDTASVTPLAHPLDAVQRLRDDVVTESVDREAFQALAPLARDGLYLVPRVIDA
jgi:aspartyl-tRNA(Asn)/glutamyl-tRNA(Gln) amidotransferase subunit C